jgi:hypothetical protein
VAKPMPWIMDHISISSKIELCCKRSLLDLNLVTNLILKSLEREKFLAGGVE